MTPPASIVTQASTSGRIWRARYSGSIAAVVIIYVVEPSPSSETSKARTAVPTTTFTGSPCTIATNRATNGANNPASIITAK